MEEKSIWDKIDFEDNTDNPLKYLKEQAELLNKKTNGVLEADVALTEAFDQESNEVVLIYQFFVYAPFIGNFRTNLFNVLQPNKPYPIKLVNRITNNKKLEASDFASFIKCIEDIMEEKDVQNLLKSLYTQSVGNRAK